MLNKELLQKANKEVQNCPETIFDTFTLYLDTNKRGHALRDDLSKLSNLYGRINELATNAILILEQAKVFRDKIESIAWEQAPDSMKSTEKKLYIRTIHVDIDGEITTLNDEISKVKTYEYIAARGKDKVKEISTLLDIGRTLLSWDKMESQQVQYN